MRFLKEKRIKELDWPGNSPDCNAIENIRDIIKVKVYKKNPKRKPELIAAIEDAWNNDTELYENVINAIHSMTRRMNAVIKAKGGHIKLTHDIILCLFSIKTGVRAG
ncbi:hypothetical protein QE152_g22441 [Popillia japonica]|uniref:Transposase n=1 Tax=Popillia japonica TaxID=7064 RepID=A0AAW1KK62_POPJA